MSFIRIKRLPLSNGEVYSGPEPLVATALSACADFYAAERTFLRVINGQFQAIPAANARAGDLIKYNTGIALEIPPDYVGLAFARSSIVKLPLELANGAGVIDSDYRGPLSYIYRILDPVDVERNSYQVGERCGQLMIVPKVSLQFEVVSELSDTSRGAGGYGSTGKQ